WKPRRGQRLSVKGDGRPAKKRPLQIASQPSYVSTSTRTAAATSHSRSAPRIPRSIQRPVVGPSPEKGTQSPRRPRPWQGSRKTRIPIDVRPGSVYLLPVGTAATKVSVSVGQLLRKKRHQFDLSLRDVSLRLAEAGGAIPVSTLARIEQGKLDPGV